LHPWTSYVIIPIFALANAGIPLSGDALSTAWSSRVTLGVFLGLVVGKTVGVFSAALLAAKLRIAVLPSGTTKLQLLATAMAAGIGFTVALFVTGLAYAEDIGLQDQAKVGIIAASIVAAIISSITYNLAARRAGTKTIGDDVDLDDATVPAVEPVPS
jgi:Na+/H+ antiporter NhaA